MTCLFGFGHTIDSNLAVRGAVSGDHGAMAEGVIRVRTRPEQPIGDAPLYARDGDALVFSAANVASYRCRPKSIDVSPCPGADAEWVSALLVATALPAALWMQGRFVLHAAGIVLKGSSYAIAIAGRSGTGKSLLAAQLLAQGARLLGEDSLALAVTNAGVTACGLPGGIHTRIGKSEDRRFDPAAPNQSVLSAPLGAIIMLDGWAEAFDCEPLSKTDAVAQIIANQHRPRIPAALKRRGSVLAQAAAIAAQVPVFLWRRRDGQTELVPSELEAIAALL